MNYIKVKGLSKSYSDINALKNLGEILRGSASLAAVCPLNFVKKECYKEAVFAVLKSGQITANQDHGVEREHHADLWIVILRISKGEGGQTTDKGQIGLRKLSQLLAFLPRAAYPNLSYFAIPMLNYQQTHVV